MRLYERGLIYRGHRVIHWCPRCLTSLSDEEAEFHETPGKLYHIALSGRRTIRRASITVATTRPETMLGDVAVAVNPDDERYRDLDRQAGDAADRRTSRFRSSPTTTPIPRSAPAW